MRTLRYWGSTVEGRGEAAIGPELAEGDGLAILVENFTDHTGAKEETTSRRCGKGGSAAKGRCCPRGWEKSTTREDRSATKGRGEAESSMLTITERSAGGRGAVESSVLTVAERSARGRGAGEGATLVIGDGGGKIESDVVLWRSDRTSKRG
ncbi:hypothetical protein BHM03_00026699 [Ensete ventricosum]|nr:hypothetical protein BHM03_00026699 [Ensete ventricosum]